MGNAHLLECDPLLPKPKKTESNPKLYIYIYIYLYIKQLGVADSLEPDFWGRIIEEQGREREREKKTNERERKPKLKSKRRPLVVLNKTFEDNAQKNPQTNKNNSIKFLIYKLNKTPKQIKKKVYIFKRSESIKNISRFHQMK